jgi:hypothetical protein
MFFSAPLFAQNPIPAGLPLEVTPLDFEFRSCRTPDGGFGRVPRTYRIRNTSNRTIVVELGGEQGTPPEDWIRGQRSARYVLDPGKVREFYLDYTYAPQQARESGFGSQFLARFDGRQFPFTLRLSGRVADCEAPQPPITDPPPGNGPQPGEPPPPGTVPPPELEPVVDVCLHFWLLEGSASTSRETIDGWIRETNQIFWSNGVRVRFTQKPGSPAPAGEPRPADDHCFDIYVGDPGLFSGAKAGECRCIGSTALNGALKGLPIDLDYDPGLGTEIEMESGGDAGKTLAHELGHAMGLGGGEAQRHEDPSTGDPITDDGRLMHPSPQGTRLTPLERDIANIAAGFLKGSPDRRGCGKSQKTTPDPPDPERSPASDIRRVDIRNVAGVLEIDFTVRGLMLPEQRILYTLEFDTDLDGTADRSVRFERERAVWRRAVTPQELAEVALDPPQFVFGASPFSGRPRTTGIIGLVTTVPKPLLGMGEGTIAWRVRLSSPPEPEEVVPKEAFATFDITDPRFTLALAGSRIQTVPGGSVELRGTASGSSTFTGSLRLFLRIEDNRRARLLSVGTVPSPLPAQWRVTAALPADIAPGSYPATVIAVCRECSAVSTFNATLEVGRAGLSPLIWAAMGITAVLAAIFARLISRRRVARG